MSAKKIRVKEGYFSILTTTPMAGRPGYFLELGGKKKTKVKTIIETILKDSASHFVVIKDDNIGQDISLLVNDIIRAGMYVLIETNGEFFNPDIPWLPQATFVVVTPTTSKINSLMVEKALAFRYVINDKTNLTKEGLPTGLYVPKNRTKIIVEPEWNNNKKQFKKNCKAAVNITLFFGFYFTFPANKVIGLK